MTKVFAFLLIVACIAIGLVSGPASARGRCPNLRHPLARSSESILYVYAPDVMGCWKPGGVRRVIAKGDGNFVPGDVGHPVVAGHFAAFTRVFHSALSDRLHVWMGNLRTGAVRSAPIEYSADWMPDGASAATVTRLVLTRTGTTAWTTDAGVWPSGVTSLPFHVQAMKRGGRIWTISDEPGIDPASLRLRGQTISWTARGVRRTARLP